jgi:hypothetical protein
LNYGYTKGKEQQQKPYDYGDYRDEDKYQSSAGFMTPVREQVYNDYESGYSGGQKSKGNYADFKMHSNFNNNNNDPFSQNKDGSGVNAIKLFFSLQLTDGKNKHS